MVLTGKKTALLLLCVFLIMGCELFQEKKQESEVKDTSISKDDAETLEVNNTNEIVLTKNGENDTSDFYRIELKAGEIFQFSTSDNVELSFEGDYKDLGSNKIQMNSSGTLYINAKFLDNNSGSFTPKVYDPNATKVDAETLSVNNDIAIINSGWNDTSDFYKIGLRSGDIFQYTYSDNVKLAFEGNYTDLGSNKIQMKADGTLYIEATFLDNSDGSFTSIVYDQNATKNEAVELSAYNEISLVNSGDNDTSDFYKINLRKDDYVIYHSSDNIELIFDGDHEVLGSTGSKMNSDGVLYIEAKFLDNKDGSLLLVAYDSLLTNELRTDLVTQKSNGSTISYDINTYGHIRVLSDMSSDPLDYPHAKIARIVKEVEAATGNVLATNFDITGLRSFVIEYESTHELRITLKDDYTNQVGFSYHLSPATSRTFVEVQLSDFVADSWGGDQNRVLDLNNIIELTIGMTEKAKGEYTFYAFDAL